jgi:hypothetical protein
MVLTGSIYFLLLGISCRNKSLEMRFIQSRAARKTHIHTYIQLIESEYGDREPIGTLRWGKSRGSLASAGWAAGR